MPKQEASSAAGHLGQRHTVQREAIVQAIRQAQGPLTVPEIHEQAVAVVPSLGIATVYRTVKLLLKANDIHQVVLPDGQARYEICGLGHHHHFRCTECHVVYDLPGCMMRILDGTALPSGFIVEGHEITLFGVCPSCST